MMNVTEPDVERRALPDLVSALRSYEQIIVTGPQRTGTTIAGRILASELEYRFVPEEQVGVTSFVQLVELYRTERRFVVQGPCFCAYAHLLPGAVVVMRRPLEEILRSQARVSWSEDEELQRYFTTEGPIARVKYDAWDRFQKPHLEKRAFELDYHALRGHALWIKEDRRKDFLARQTSVTMTRHDLCDAAYFQEAVRRAPGDAQAYFDLARAWARQRRGTEAVVCFRQALRLNPNFAAAHKRLGDVLSRRHGTPLDEAAACYREAIRCRPEYAEAYDRLGCTLHDMGLPDEALAAHRHACELQPDSPTLHSSLLFDLHYHPAGDPAQLAVEHDRWNERHAAPLSAEIQPHINDPDPDRRLRIGYVSAHLGRHPVGRFLLPLFKERDRENFEVYCYSSLSQPDSLTAALRRLSDRWHSTAEVADEALADLVRQDQIDILVELDLHAPHNRLLTFARKPAPVQVTYLGYCSTTGLRTIDYRITDPYFDPPEQPSFYAEESIRLPETYWCYQPHANLPASGPLPALVNGHVTFGCFNNFSKVSWPAVTVWRDVLRQVPASRLLLHARPGSHRDRVRAFFDEGGVDPDRVEFEEYTTERRYFDNYQRVDIGLDPFPCAGGTTTCDALWMGVPVVTLAGALALSRAGLSILSNVGVPELAARTPPEYVGIAAALAADLPRLAALRAGLRERMRRSPLMDGPRFARRMENAFRAMWRRWCLQR
jgi:protein O-GlcNAc transferase